MKLLRFFFTLPFAVFATVSLAWADDNTAISCDGFIAPGSALADMIDNANSSPNCMRSHGPLDIYADNYRVSGLAPWSETEFAHIFITVFRYFGPEAPGGNPIAIGDNFKILTGTVPVSLPGIDGEGKVSRFDMSPADGNATMACLEAYTNNGPKSQTIMQLCKSLELSADDHKVMKAVRDIAARYMSQFIP